MMRAIRINITFRVALTLTIIFIGFSVKSQIPTDGLIASFPFNGNANDESGNGYDGTVNGAILDKDRFGNLHSAYEFDGIDDYIDIANSSLVDGQSALTVSCWIRRDASSGYGLPIHAGNQGRFGFHAIKDSIKVNVSTNSSVSGHTFTEFATPPVYYDQTEWTNIVLWYDGQNLRIYVNGQQREEIYAEGILNTPQTSHLAFGVYMFFNNPNHGYYKGILDDVNIYNRELSEFEITQLYGDFHIPPVNQQDSIALVALYNSTDGDNWINNDNWLIGPVSSWHGISIVDGRVGVISLAFNNLKGELPNEIGNLSYVGSFYLMGNDLSGDIPASLANLTNLYNLDIANNNFTHLPDMRHIHFGGPVGLGLIGNKFEFDDLERGYQESINFRYSNQQNVGETKTVSINVGDNHNYKLPVGGSQNQYQWFEVNDQGDTIELTSQNTNSLVFHSANLDDDGVYLLKTSNELFPYLELWSNPYTLQVQETFESSFTNYNKSYFNVEIVGQDTKCLNEPSEYALNIDTFGNKYLFRDTTETVEGGNGGRALDAGYHFHDITNTFSYDLWVKPTQSISMKSESNACAGDVSVPLAFTSQNWAILPLGLANGDMSVGLTIGTNGVMVGEHSGNILVSRLSHTTNIDDWIHVAIVYTEDQIALYLNGELVRSRDTHCPTDTKCIASGLAGYYYSNDFKGNIDEFRLWDKALTIDEINTIKNKKFVNEVEGLRYYVSFDNGQFTKSLGDLGTDSLDVRTISAKRNIKESFWELDPYMGNDINSLELFTVESLNYSWSNGSDQAIATYQLESGENQISALAFTDYFSISDTLFAKGIECNEAIDSEDAFVARYQSIKKSERCFTLTEELNNQYGAIWLRDKIDFSKDTVLDFTIYMGNRDGNGADGIAFLIHNDPRDTIHDPNNQVIIGGADTYDLVGAMGDDGGGLGYAMHLSRVGPNTIPGPHGPGDDPENHKIQPSIAIEFDTWNNSDVPDGRSGNDAHGIYQPTSPYFGWDHTSLVYNGSLYSHIQNIEDANGGKGRILPLKPEYAFGANNHNIEDDQAYTYEVRWTNEVNGEQTLEMWANIYTGSTDDNSDKYLIFKHTANYIDSLFKGETVLRAGFTGSTGGAINEQTVCFNNDIYNYAVDDFVSVNANDSIYIDVLHNETPGIEPYSDDPEIIDQPDNGSASVTKEKSDNKHKIKYKPNKGFSGIDSLKYVRKDVKGKPYGQLDTATVFIEVIENGNNPVTTFIMDEKQNVRDRDILFPVSVEGFNDVLTVQYTMTWDPLVIEYQGVQDFAIDDLATGSFNLVEPGKMTLSWTPSDNQPKTVADQTEIFNILFKAIGNSGDFSDVNFTEDPTPKEVSINNGVIVSAQYINGKISIVDEVILGGYIKTQKGEALEDIEVELIGSLEQNTYTDKFGWYSFSVLPNQLYHIAPLFDTDADDGISTLDIVIMHWHVLGKKYMMSNLDLIACDVNGSGSLTTLDLAETRSVVLHNDDKFRDKNSVEFVNNEYTGDGNVFTYKNYLDIIPTVSHLNLNYTAVKRGDANQSWKLNKNKNGRKQHFEEIEIEIEQGEVIADRTRILLKALDFEHIIGLQFTLEWNPDVYQFEMLTKNQVDFISNQNLVSNGKMTVTWNSDGIEGLTLDKGSILSNLEFTVLDGIVDPEIKITSGITPAFAYNSNLETLSIMNSNTLNKLKELIIYPNPAEDFVKFSIPREGISHYSILTATGIVISSGDVYENNEINITHLKKGMYILQISDNNDYVLSKKFLKE